MPIHGTPASDFSEDISLPWDEIIYIFELTI